MDGVFATQFTFSFIFLFISLFLGSYYWSINASYVPNTYIELLLKISTALLGCIAVYGVFQKALIKETFLKWFGVSSLGIYAIHYHLIAALHEYLPFFVLFIVVCLLSLSGVLLIRRSNYLRPWIGERIVWKSMNKM